MDLANLPEGYYFDEIHGTIEYFGPPKKAVDAPEANTVTLYHEHSRGIVDSDIAKDEAGWLFLAVAKANMDNPNIRWVDVYKSVRPGVPVFDTTPLTPPTSPPLKIDFCKATANTGESGTNLLISVTDHAPAEAPRDSNVDALEYVGVCSTKPGYTPPPQPTTGPCVPPGNLPYFRPNNNLSRGQVSKMIILALEAVGLSVPEVAEGQQSFQDIPVGSTHYEYVEKLHALGAIGGYGCTPPPPAPKP